MLDRFNVNLDISGSLGEGSGSGAMPNMGHRRTHHAGSSSKGRVNANADISHSMDSGDFHVSASESQMSRISGRNKSHGDRKGRSTSKGSINQPPSASKTQTSQMYQPDFNKLTSFGGQDRNNSQLEDIEEDIKSK